MTEAKDFPRYDGANYEVAESVGHHLVSLVQMMRREVELRMARHDLTDAQWKPLWLLKSGRATTAIELAREACVDAGAVTRMIDRLEDKGLIERARSRPTGAWCTCASRRPARLPRRASRTCWPR